MCAFVLWIADTPTRWTGTAAAVKVKCCEHSSTSLKIRRRLCHVTRRDTPAAVCHVWNGTVP